MYGIPGPSIRGGSRRNYVRSIGIRGPFVVIRGQPKYVRLIGRSDGRGRGIAGAGKGESMSGISVPRLLLAGSRRSKRAGMWRSRAFFDRLRASPRQVKGSLEGELCPEYR